MVTEKIILFVLMGLLLFPAPRVFAGQPMKPHHRDSGLSCADCHAAEPAASVPMEQCLNCHQLPEPKNDYHGAPDKHDSPHYGPELECENCHHEHEASEDFCAQCHEFDFQVP